MNTSSELSWFELLERRGGEHRAWLRVPSAPHLNGEHSAVSYAELFDGVCRVGAFLRAHGAGGGDRVVVVADNTPEACVLLLGVLAAGAIVVPVHPPGLTRNEQDYRDGLARLCAACGACGVLLARRGALEAPFPGVWIGDALDVARTRADAARPAVAQASAALIQYTSGTTGTKRGVELSHANLFHNVENIGRAFGATADDVCGLWLPLFHDMGLIGSLLFATYWGMSIVLQTPRMFATRPESWLWAIARFGVTCTAAPNAAYQLCAERLTEQRLAGLALDRWRIAFNGSELIHAPTLERFSARFARYGLRGDVVQPVYGLAENTVAATLPLGSRARVDWIDRCGLEQDAAARPSAPDEPGARAVVCVGRSLDGQELRIADPESGQVLGSERAVGEIQVRGGSTMRGYHGRPRTEGFTADGWLRTGDRGYLAHDNLYVVGRYKHIVKHAGRALDCAFIEGALRGLQGLRGAVAVFGVANPSTGSEDLVVMAETALDDGEQRVALSRSIAHTVRAAVDLAPSRIELVAPGTVPRTTSGKVRHGAAANLASGL